MKYRRLTVATLVGVAVPCLGVCLYSFLRLAYQQNALSDQWIKLSSSILKIPEWPCLLVEGFGITLATIFYDPHFVGSLFWHSLFEYLFINSIGWTLLAYGVIRAVSYLSLRRGFRAAR